jgi:hypothetical protein
MSNTNPHEKNSLSLTMIAVLWPSFLVAGVATGLFFSALDPMLITHELNLPATRTAAYSTGFFGFWSLSALSSAATLYFRRLPNR